MKNWNCTCFNRPPCAFCVELTEEESDAVGNGGRAALEAFWESQESDPDIMTIGELATSETGDADMGEALEDVYDKAERPHIVLSRGTWFIVNFKHPTNSYSGPDRESMAAGLRLDGSAFYCADCSAKVRRICKISEIGGPPNVRD